MLSRYSAEYHDVTVTASGGSGSTTFTHLGLLRLVCIKASGKSFDFDIEDDSGYILAGMTGNSGNTTIQLEVPLVEKCTINITNATDGSYSLRLYFYLSA